MFYYCLAWNASYYLLTCYRLWVRHISPLFTLSAIFSLLINALLLILWNCCNRFRIIGIRSGSLRVGLLYFQNAPLSQRYLILSLVFLLSDTLQAITQIIAFDSIVNEFHHFFFGAFLGDLFAFSKGHSSYLFCWLLFKGSHLLFRLNFLGRFDFQV